MASITILQKKTKPDSSSSQPESGDLDSEVSTPANHNDREKKAQGQQKKQPKPKTNGGKYGFDDYPSAPTNVIKLDHQIGDCCPYCKIGKLYQGQNRKQLQFHAHAPIEVSRYIRETLRCNRCSLEVVARLPKGFEKWTPEAKSTAVLFKTAGIPFYRLQKLQLLYGIPLAANTLWQNSADVWNAGAKYIFAELLQQLSECHYINMDDTGARILEIIEKNKSLEEKDRKACHSTTIIGDTPEGHQIEMYITANDYAGNTIAPMLNKSKNLNNGHHLTIMSDASRMNTPKVNKELSHRIYHATCVQHGRQKFVEIRNDYPECEYFLKEIGEIFEYERQFKDDSPKKRLKLRKQYSSKHIGNIYRRIDYLFSTKAVEPNSSLGKAMKYWLNHKKGLTTFLRRKEAEVSNNRAERALKTLILQRKNSLFFYSLSSAEVLSGLSSIVQTCKVNGINTFGYLNWLQANSRQCKENPSAYLPWKFKENHYLNNTELIKKAA